MCTAKLDSQDTSFKSHIAELGTISITHDIKTFKRIIRKQRILKFLNIFGKDGRLNCGHLVNYTQRAVKVELQTPVPHLGKVGVSVGVEPKLLQSASHAVMLLDASSYHLCKMIEALTDKEKRQKYIEESINDKFYAGRIYITLEAVRESPDSKELQEALARLLVEAGTRVVEIERGMPKPPPTTETITGDSLDIGDDAFSDKFKNLERLLPQLQHHISQDEHDKENLRHVFINLSIKYDEAIREGNSKQFYNALAPIIGKLRIDPLCFDIQR